MHNKLIIIGASGQGKVVADIALKLNEYEEIVFLDDNENTEECMGIPVKGKSSDMEQYVDEADFFVAIGNAKVRKKLTEQLKVLGATIPVLIHPNAVIGEWVTIGEGTVIMAGAVVNPNCVIGKGCIVNTCSSVDHDCCIGDYVHVAVGTHIAGTVKIKDNTFIGAGVTIKNNVNVCCDCIIGAGAVVVKDIEETGTYVGVPARRR